MSPTNWREKDFLHVTKKKKYNPPAVLDLVGTLSSFSPGKPLSKYIAHARFPNFKNLAPYSEIEFTFPFTALVGPNGVGKTSVLHALWGMPKGYSTAKFWFETELDKIESKRLDPPRYVYGHWHDTYGDVVETKKSRIGRSRGYEYWEPARATTKDKMPKVPKGKYPGKSKDRWNPVERQCVYINFKAVFGSFDRYFYIDDATSEREKKTAMLLEARRLRRIADNDKQSLVLGGKQRIIKNRFLTESELEVVSYILNKTYRSARLIEHSLYKGAKGRDFSVIFESGIEYSEAYAGSGELAAVLVVVKVLESDDFSLVLLDEPETSLHPGAQFRLLQFLLDQIVKKKLQIVVSTHSADLIEPLPPRAIKVMEQDEKGKAQFLPKCNSNIAFRCLGRPPSNITRVLVEDELAELLVKRACDLLDQGDRDAVEIVVSPGGAESILCHQIPAAIASKDQICVLLDGDQRCVRSIRDPESISPSEYGELSKIVRDQVGVIPKFNLSGGNDKDGHDRQKSESYIAYLRWVRMRLRYLPLMIPEEIVIKELYPDKHQDGLGAKEIKDIYLRCVYEGQKLTSEEAYGIQKVIVARIDDNSQYLKIISEQIEELLLLDK